MAVAVKLPKMSDTMEEGVLVSWQVKVGDVVKPGDILAEVETDKATMDLENYEKGTILHLHVEEGATIVVDAIVAIIGAKGEDFEELLTQQTTTEKVSSPAVDSAPAVEIIQTKPAISIPPTPQTDQRVKASPLAKMMAREKGLDLGSVPGSGEGGRVVRRDVENFVPSTTGSLREESFTEAPVSQMRKAIARRLSESKFSAPHFYLTMELRMDRAIEARAEINAYAEVKISMNDLIVKAAAVALKKHPKVNSSWLNDKIRMNHHIHIGVAIAVEDGLLVPVVKYADEKSLSQISVEVKAYSAKAKEKKLKPEDWEGNTFTISNLGMFGIEEFTAIINTPDTCIMAVGAAKESVVVEGGEMKVGWLMKVTLSCDHRAVDGVLGSQFLNTFKELLENPVKLLV